MKRLFQNQSSLSDLKENIPMLQESKENQLAGGFLGISGKQAKARGLVDVCPDNFICPDNVFCLDTTPTSTATPLPL